MLWGGLRTKARKEEKRHRRNEGTNTHTERPSNLATHTLAGSFFIVSIIVGYFFVFFFSLFPCSVRFNFKLHNIPLCLSLNLLEGTSHQPTNINLRPTMTTADLCQDAQELDLLITKMKDLLVQCKQPLLIPLYSPVFLSVSLCVSLSPSLSLSLSLCPPPSLVYSAVVFNNFYSG